MLWVYCARCRYTTTVFDVGCIIGVRAWLQWAPAHTCTALSDRPVYNPPSVTLLDVQVRVLLVVVAQIVTPAGRVLRGQGSG